MILRFLGSALSKKNCRMANEWFKFKQFTVWQDRTPMKVGTDGVLLGAWTDADRPGRILDIGTGTGLIALMMAQKFPAAMIDAVEIDKDAAMQAGENFRLSPWSERLRVFHTDVLDFISHKEKEYSLIVSNPPWFSRSLKASSAGRTVARHNDSLPAGGLLRCVSKLLLSGGCFSIVLPADLEGSFIRKASESGLFPSKILRVRPVPQKAVSRILMEMRFSEEALREDELIIEPEGRHCYSEAYRKLTSDFYLAF
jgi:tRNA1Val (adenine37-N6)-methyltransferase